MASSHSERTYPGPNRFVGLVAVVVCMACSARVAGQVSPLLGVVLIRNIRLADEKTGVVRTAVLISAGKITQVDANLAAPAGATVIDGGGNFLTILGDGTFKLTATSDSTIPAENVTAINEAKEPGPSQPIQDLSPKVRFSSAAYTDPRGRYPRQFRKQQTQQPADEDLAQKVTDPSAALKSITFQNKYSPAHWGIDDDENEFNVQAAIPHGLGGKSNIFRITIPLFTNTPAPGNNGVGDVALLNVTVLPQKWGNFLIGPVATFGMNKGPGVDTFAIGPSIGAILKHKKWTYGVFSQNLFSFGGDIQTTQIQPVLSYTVNKKISLSLGDAQQTIDWHRGFILNPLGIQVNYIAKFGNQPVRFFVNPLYNLNHTFAQRQFLIATGFALILK